MDAPSETPAASPAAAQEGEDGSCAVCAQRARATVFTACGHHVLCEPCTTELVGRGQPCPVCRQAVDGAAGWRTLPAGLGRAPSFLPDAVDPKVRAKAARTAWRARLSDALGGLMSAVWDDDAASFLETKQMHVLEGDNAALTLRCDGVEGSEPCESRCSSAWSGHGWSGSLIDWRRAALG